MELRWKQDGIEIQHGSRLELRWNMDSSMEIQRKELALTCIVLLSLLAYTAWAIQKEV